MVERKRRLDELANTCGKCNRLGRLAERAYRTVDSLRSELDDQLCRDYPKQFDPDVYYPRQHGQPPVPAATPLT